MFGNIACDLHQVQLQAEIFGMRHERKRAIGPAAVSRSARSSGPSIGPAQFRLTNRSVANVIKAHAELAGFDATGHSLRSGFLTSAAVKGASIFKMIDVSRHKSVGTLAGPTDAGKSPRLLCGSLQCFVPQAGTKHNSGRTKPFSAPGEDIRQPALDTNRPSNQGRKGP
jgi:hypothetical protein